MRNARRSSAGLANGSTNYSSAVSKNAFWLLQPHVSGIPHSSNNSLMAKGKGAKSR